MYVPFISTENLSIYRRKGGGGGGGGHVGDSGGVGGGGDKAGGGSSSSGSSGSHAGGGSSSSKGSTSSKPKSSVPLSGKVPGGSSTATAYGNGGGKSITIPSGQMFTGRSAGGGTRDQIYGTRTYGSGYPGITGRGVSGRGFPFYFWPAVWGSATGVGIGYLDDPEYGEPNNSSRPGGPLYDGTLPPASGNMTFHIIADNSTVVSLLSSIRSNCSSLLSSNLPSPVPINGSDPNGPKPEQAVQYYRASSIVLTLDGYNDTAALTGDNSTTQQDIPLPGCVNSTFLACVNQTIGAAAPLIVTSSGSSTRWATPDQPVVTFISSGWLLWMLWNLVF